MRLAALVQRKTTAGATSSGWKAFAHLGGQAEQPVLTLERCRTAKGRLQKAD
jgi:hypothetical protein